MEPHISCDVVLLKTAYEVYQSIADSFASDKNANLIFELCDEIFLSKQQGQSLKDFFFFFERSLKDL